MLDLPIHDPGATEAIATAFHRDGLALVRDVVTPSQLARLRAGADRVMRAQIAATPPEQANRGHARYSFGDQLHEPEWRVLIDLPTILPALASIWGSEDFTCSGGGGDYSLPGARMQGLHADGPDFLRDPWGQTTLQDLPTPWIVVNLPLVEFTKTNGATRFVPGTHRRRHPPTPSDEPRWMQDSTISAPAGYAIIRDARCWHGGTPNTSDQARPMVSMGYYAPWRRPVEDLRLTEDEYLALPPRAQRLCRFLVAAPRLSPVAAA